MRVNVYAEEMTDHVELVTKRTSEGEFTGVRFYLELPISDGRITTQGPFIHRDGDDDTAAVTFWGKKRLREALVKAIALLDERPISGNPMAVDGCPEHPSRRK